MTDRHGRKAKVTSTYSQSSGTEPSSQKVSAGDSGSVPTSAESCSVHQKALRHQRGKNGGAAAGPAAAAGAASGRPLVPFRGFSREYAEAHIKAVQEAIHRKEIMIKLLKSGTLTDRQLKAILPSCNTQCDEVFCCCFKYL